MDLRIPFVVFYIAIDILYVYVSRGYYGAVAAKIQNASMDADLLAVGASYLTMAFAWWFITTTLVDKYVLAGYHYVMAGLMAGAITGFVIYGVYNFTNKAMFKKYQWSTVLRDLGWGTLSSSMITALYAYFVYA